MTRTEQKVQERYAARPFNLKAYAQAARGTVEQFCRDMGIDSAVVYVWSRAQEAPWCLYERAVAKFGQAGFSAPAKVWREGRPFRVPAHILGTPTPTPVAVAPPVPALPPKVPATSAELLLQLATQLDDESRHQAAKLEELTTRLQQVEAALAAIQSAPKAVTQPPTVVEKSVPPPKRPTLEDIVARYNNGSKTTWLVTNRAAKEYSLLSHQDQDRAVEAIKALIDAPNWHKVPKARQVPPAHNNPFPQEHDLWYLRHGKYRTFIARQGTIRKIRAIVDRGDKQFFGYEL